MNHCLKTGTALGLLGLGLAFFVPTGGCGGAQPVVDMPVDLAGPIRTCAVQHERHVEGSDHTVKFDVALVNGQVDTLVLVQSTLNDEELEKCLASKIRSFTVDDLPLRASANLERDLTSPESRALLGNPAAAPLAACLASPPCLLGLVVVMGAAVITVQLTVYSATTTAPAIAAPATPVPTTTTTATPTATATTTTTSPPIAASQRCLPCLPVPVGGNGYDYHSVTNGNDPHYGMAEHTHHFRMNQSPPPHCRCFWNRDFIHPTNGFSPLPGAVLVISTPGGGGLAP